MTFTRESLIEHAKSSKEEYINLHIPALSMRYFDFAEQSDLDLDTYYTFRAYIKKASYDERSNCSAV